MQRAENMQLLGTMPPARPRAADLSSLVMQPRKAGPAAQRRASAPARRPLAPPQESRPAGAVMARRSGFSGILGRLHDGDPVLLAHLRRHPDEARQLAAHLDRLLLEV